MSEATPITFEVRLYMRIWNRKFGPRNSHTMYNVIHEGWPLMFDADCRRPRLATHPDVLWWASLHTRMDTHYHDCSKALTAETLPMGGVRFTCECKNARVDFEFACQ